VAAVYSLFVSLFIYREVKLGGLLDLLVGAARTTSTVMFLCAGALVSSYMVTLADLPAQVSDFLAPLMGDPAHLDGRRDVAVAGDRHGHGPDADDPW